MLYYYSLFVGSFAVINLINVDIFSSKISFYWLFSLAEQFHRISFECIIFL